MWRLEQIQAKNFSAFRELDYTLHQGHATLIFGNNLDNDSQKSNGSGKSALIEAIAVGLTGSTLRNIKTEEIINDNADEANVSLILSNDYSRAVLKIERVLSRKKPQEIEILSANSAINENYSWQPIIQSSVADYNRHILDLIGLSKEDIYANFILCKHKYQSFLSSSDKEKKEIINHFSNGIMVDESIMALQEDMAPIQEKLNEAIDATNIAKGRLSAIHEQIESAITQSEEQSKNKVERIKEWKEAICLKREFIRQQEESIRTNEALLSNLEKLGKDLEKLESSKSSIQEVYGNVNELFKAGNMPSISDYSKKFADINASLDELEKESEESQRSLKELEATLQEAKDNHQSLCGDYNTFQDKKAQSLPEINNKIQQLLDEVKKCDNDLKSALKDRINLNNAIANLKNILAGVIVCPKCKYEFTLSNDVNVEEVRDTLADTMGVCDENERRIEALQNRIDERTELGKATRKEQNKWQELEADWSNKITISQTSINRASNKVASAKGAFDSLKNRIIKATSDLNNLKDSLFDEAFKKYNDYVDGVEARIDKAETVIKNAQGTIQSYEESIANIEHASENNIIDSLKSSEIKYQKELNLAILDKERVEKELASYKVQEATFIEFKTHLANTKIEALSHITNEFLEAIGSDIRIAFSGFTVLKSGKIRDKISISLLRDGLNCGSFDKFSEGEKARVNLANILAMHKLTNVNCADGKGLDLLVLDEILDATDETGLANIFESLNSFKITSLVVSHGNIAENYPYKLIVNKQNGVSFINGQK